MVFEVWQRSYEVLDAIFPHVVPVHPDARAPLLTMDLHSPALSTMAYLFILLR